MTKSVTIRLNEETHTFLKGNFEGLQAGISLLVEPFERLRITTANELKGYFTKEEITALVDSQNGVLLTSDFIYNKSFFAFQIEDFEQLENGVSRHGVDVETLIKKIKDLSSVQVYYLLLDIHIFWQTGGTLNAYIEKLT